MVIEDLVKTVLGEIKRMMQTETVIGTPMEVGDITLIPVSKVSVGFAAGGKKTNEKLREGEGTGGGMLIEPVAFIVIRQNKVELLTMKKESIGWGQVMELIPEVVDKIKGWKAPPGVENRKEKKKP